MFIWCLVWNFNYGFKKNSLCFLLFLSAPLRYKFVFSILSPHILTHVEAFFKVKTGMIVQYVKVLFSLVLEMFTLEFSNQKGWLKPKATMPSFDFTSHMFQTFSRMIIPRKLIWPDRSPVHTWEHEISGFQLPFHGNFLPVHENVICG